MANEAQTRIAEIKDSINKFQNYKTLGLGDRDATRRYGKNIPLDTPTNFSAGYSGAATVELSENFIGGGE
jgi:hypothetical protein